MDLPPSEIRYTSANISSRFSDTIPLTATFAKLLQGDFAVEDLPRIKCAKRGEHWYAIKGNRRLFLFKKLEELGVVSTITVLEDAHCNADHLPERFEGKEVKCHDGELQSQIQKIISEHEKGEDIVAKWGANVLSSQQDQDDYPDFEEQGDYQDYEEQGDYPDYEEQGDYPDYEEQGDYQDYEEQGDGQDYEDQYEEQDNEGQNTDYHYGGQNYNGVHGGQEYDEDEDDEDREYDENQRGQKNKAQNDDYSTDDDDDYYRNQDDDYYYYNRDREDDEDERRRDYYYYNRDEEDDKDEGRQDDNRDSNCSVM